MGLVLEAAGFALVGGAAVPGFHAQKRRAGFGPEGKHGEVMKVQEDAMARGLVPQGDALRAKILEDEGVQALEGGVVQGYRSAGEHGLFRAVPKEALGGEKEGVRVLAIVKGEGVVLETLAGEEGTADGGVGPDAKRQRLLSGVFYSEGGGKAVCEKLVPDPEDKGEGELGQGLRALPKLQDGVVLALVHGGEFALPRKTMAAHFKGLAADVRLAVFETADNGEEYGILPGPEGGVALPEIFGSGAVPEGDQLAAVGLDGGGEGGVGEGVKHGNTSCHSYSTNPIIWGCIFYAFIGKTFANLLIFHLLFLASIFLGIKIVSHQAAII